MIINTETQQIESPRQIREATGIPLPRNPAAETLAQLTPPRVYVVESEPPVGDVVEPAGFEQGEDGEWRQTWNVRDLTAEEIDQRRQQHFSDLHSQLTDIHNRYCSGTTPYAGIEISIDVEARVNAQGTLSAVKNGTQPLPFEWFNGSDSVTVESEADMQAIHDAIFAALQRRFVAKGKVLAAIDTVTDPASYDVAVAYRAHL